MGKLLKSYVFWTYERGSVHFDIMVTAILLFMFVSPHFINFGDRPVETVALERSEVLVKAAGPYRFIYQIRADSMGSARTEPELGEAILRQVEPISGEVKLERYEAVKDSAGRVVAYNAYVTRR